MSDESKKEINSIIGIFKLAIRKQRRRGLLNKNLEATKAKSKFNVSSSGVKAE